MIQQIIAFCVGAVVYGIGVALFIMGVSIVWGAR